MNNFNFNSRSSNIENITPQAVERTRTLMTRTFVWMFIALLVSAASTLLFSLVPQLQSLLYTQVVVVKAGVEQLIAKPTTLFWIILFLPFIFSLVMNFGFERLSFFTLFSLFMLYAFFTGVTMTVILLRYDSETVMKSFFSAAGLFGFMAVVGATTKTDLTSFGRILMFGLVGIMIAIVINFFTQSSAFSYFISVAGVAIFVGLVAYRVQNIKRLSAESDGSTSFLKLGVMSAFMLYLTFINIFLFLLRIFGRRD